MCAGSFILIFLFHAHPLLYMPCSVKSHNVRPFRVDIYLVNNQNDTRFYNILGTIKNMICPHMHDKFAALYSTEKIQARMCVVTSTLKLFIQNSMWLL